VEDEAERVAAAGTHAADPVAQVDAIGPARALDGPMVDGEGDRVAAAERHHLDARLHARPLLGQHELAAGEILAGRASSGPERQLKDNTETAATSLRAERIKARAWIENVDERRRRVAAWSFVAEAVTAYMEAHGRSLNQPLQVPPLSLALTYHLDRLASELARRLGSAAASLPVERASFEISATYAALLPPTLRSAWGAFYTPPVLSNRLLELAAAAGVDWRETHVLDPACGAGAFLLPVALRMREALHGTGPDRVLAHLATHLRGLEIDPFAAWLAQVWLEIAFADETRATGQAFPSLVTVCNSLDQVPDGDGFDLVIGNPPYGRITLSAAQRSRYRRGLYGHANLYGLFTDLAMRWSRPGGLVAYVTPTSFLSGEYFKALRCLLAREAPPVAIDFVSARKGVFEDVLQEAALAVYRSGGPVREVAVHYIAVTAESSARLTSSGHFNLPAQPDAPWLAPREPRHRRVTASAQMSGNASLPT
jgi:adenine-specific DNA-methyltransferase